MTLNIPAGVVWVKTYRAASPIAPFGGGRSGDGHEGGPAAALDFTRTKTVWRRASDDPIPDPFVILPSIRDLIEVAEKKKNTLQ